ncbi:hypothetical protein DPMN_004497 [Dreissena polymorpha]|uniref:Uncharacterized protein n=1 Tax=Dreissena polymorpha TaxID=45954 RepID=A0A9D4MNL2_DREPO|nr:hypothetical protein DPMN_004497 [Dreissena polymorpha]
MQHANESFLKINEVVEELTLVLQMFPNDACAAVDLFHCAPPSTEFSLLFGQQFLGLIFQSITNDE